MFQDWQRTQTQSSVTIRKGSDSEWMSGSAKAGTIAERHTCELRVLPKLAVENFVLLDKDFHGGRQTRSDPETSFLKNGGSEWESNPPVTGLPAARRF